MFVFVVPITPAQAGAITITTGILFFLLIGFAAKSSHDKEVAAEKTAVAIDAKCGPVTKNVTNLQESNDVRMKRQKMEFECMLDHGRYKNWLEQPSCEYFKTMLTEAQWCRFVETETPRVKPK